MHRTRIRPPIGPVASPARRAAVTGVLLVTLGGCAGASPTPAPPASGAPSGVTTAASAPNPAVSAGSGLVDPDTPVPDAGSPGPDFPTEEVIEGAKDLLGTPAAALPDGVRVVRDGDETFTVTQDFVPGRVSVELDEAGSTSEVTVVTVELPDGPRTFRQR